MLCELRNISTNRKERTDKKQQTNGRVIKTKPGAEKLNVLLGQVEYCNKLSPQVFGLLEALRKHDDLGNKLVVWSRHGHRTEQLLQVVGQLLSAAITFTSRVHGDENTRVEVDLNL